jgi:hypothetical protein
MRPRPPNQELRIKTCESRTANCASFFGKAAVVFEPFEWRPDLSLPGALHNSGNKPAPPSEHTPLGRRSAFWPPGWACARRDAGHNEMGPDRNRSPFRPPATGDYLDEYPGDYFSELFIDVNRPFRFEPRPLTAAMMARLMPAAINPYSIAVAADWSAKNLENVVSGKPAVNSRPFCCGLLPEHNPDRLSGAIRIRQDAPRKVGVVDQAARAAALDGSRMSALRARRAAAPVNAVGRRGPVMIRAVTSLQP